MVLPVSEHLRRADSEYGVKASFRVVPNVVDTRLFCTTWWPKSGDENGPKKLLFVANLSEQKGIPLSAEALKQSCREADGLLPGHSR